jgi:beta-N-acetylhexosaminidase
MSTRAFITGVTGTELTAAKRAFGCAGCSWDFSPFRLSFEISTQVAVPATELLSPHLIAANRADLSILVDGVAEPAHPGTTSATMIAQVIRDQSGSRIC